MTLNVLIIYIQTCKTVYFKCMLLTKKYYEKEEGQSTGLLGPSAAGGTSCTVEKRIRRDCDKLNHMKWLRYCETNTQTFFFFPHMGKQTHTVPESLMLRILDCMSAVVNKAESAQNA